MYVCICKAVSYEDIEKTGNSCGAGTGCGTCLNEINEILEELGNKTAAEVEDSNKTNA